MAKDQETGVDPKATDGKPNGDEPESLEQARRRLRDEKDEAAVTGNGKKGNPIDGQDPGTDDEPDGQMFMVEGRGKVSMGTLIPRGKPVEHAFVFSQARRKGSGGLIPPEDDVLLVVRGKVGSVKPTYKRDDNEDIKSVTVEQLITTKVVVPADSDEAMDLLAGVLEARGYKLTKVA